MVKTVLRKFLVQIPRLCLLSVWVLVTCLTFSAHANAMNSVGQSCHALFTKKVILSGAPSFIERLSALTTRLGKHKVNGNLLADLLSASAGVTEGYSVNQHNHRVGEVYGDQINFWREKLERASGITGSRLDDFFATLIVLHDIGKPLAQKKGNLALQHAETIPIMIEVLKREGWNDREIKISEALVGQDAFGKFIKGNADLYKTTENLLKAATLANIPANDYFFLQKFFYICDASSYPKLRDVIFAQDKNNEITLPSVRSNLLAVELGKRSPKLPESWSEEKLKRTKEQLMRHQEELFLRLFVREGFSDFHSYEQQLLQKVSEMESFYRKDEKRYAQQLRALARIRDLYHGNIDIRIAVHSSLIPSIVKNGYLNRVESGAESVQGAGGDVQDRTEGSFLGLRESQMAKMPAQLRPHYGMLAPSPEATSVREFRDAPADHIHNTYLREDYNATVVLDLKDYFDSLTLSAADSANSMQDFQARKKPYVQPWEVQYNEPVAWDQVFIPWKYRMVLASSLVSEGHLWDGFNSFVGNPKMLFADFPDAQPLFNLTKTFPKSAGVGKASYIEAEIMSAVKKIKAIEIVEDETLDANTLNDLKAKGIALRTFSSYVYPAKTRDLSTGR